MFNRGMSAVLTAQFFSAFGDNALLFVTLAMMDHLLYPDWSKPLIQIAFVAAYIFLAPFVGQIADSFPKGRVMMCSNLLKMLGALVIAIWANPFLGYTLVGIGAALYSPAKYGIIVDIVSDKHLVKGNSWMESSTIAAILTGSVAGGLMSDFHLTFALWLCVLVYGLAFLANLSIPTLKASRPGSSWKLRRMIGDFYHSTVTLWQNAETRLSLVGTSLFWGAGVTLRFLLVLWVPVVLGDNSKTLPTLLNAMVAVGIVIGAILAAKYVTLENIKRTLPAGLAIGLLVILFSQQNSLLLSYGLLILVGISGGFFIVPLNALLQQRSQHTVGTGRAIAVQNFGENIAMLVMLLLYSLMVKLGVPAVILGTGFGVLFALLIVALWLWSRGAKLHPKELYQKELHPKDPHQRNLP